MKRATMATWADIVPGARLHDNDSRQRGRVLVVTGYTFADGRPEKVLARTPAGSMVSIGIHRVFADGKTRNYGYNIERAEREQAAA